MAQVRHWYQLSRTFAIVLGCVALFLFSVWMWGFQTIIYFKFCREAKQHPILDYTPAELPSVEPNHSNGLVLTHRGFEFEVPWTDLNPDKSKVVGTWAIFVFDSGSVLTLCTPSKDNMRKEIEKDFGGYRSMTALFGSESLRSNYAFHQALLQQTTANLRPWMARQDAVRSSMTLLIKAISSVGGQTGLFKVSANVWRGFQFDDPSKTPGKVTLELFDSDDQQVEISVAVRKDAKSQPTQADINRIIGTLRKSKAPDTLAAKETETTENHAEAARVSVSTR